MYESILADNPNQTRVRLELAKALFAMGRTQSADRQFRIAAQDSELPPEIARTIRTARDVIRSKRAWTLNVDVGIAPDTNINNATAADTVTVMFGPVPIPLQLDANARARSGTGRTGSVDAGLRLPIGGDVSLLADLDAVGTDYSGRTFDDFYSEARSAASSRSTRRRACRCRASCRSASSAGGSPAGNGAPRPGTKPRSASPRGSACSSTRGAPRRGSTPITMAGRPDSTPPTSARSPRRSSPRAGCSRAGDILAAKAYSSAELGAIAGVGGELPWGFNLGVSGTVSRALFDAPLQIFSVDPRRDWRLNVRATVGNRALRWMGFSPSVSLSWGRVDSSLAYYASQRTRLRFAVARYF